VFQMIPKRDFKTWGHTATYENGEHEIMMFMMIGEETEAAVAAFPENTIRRIFKEKPKSIRRYEEVFVHELVHVLDATRLGFDKWQQITKDRDAQANKLPLDAKKARQRVYINSPVEMNAYFQQVAGFVAKDAKQDPSILNDINSFYDHFIDRAEDMVHGALNWRQRNIPRLKKRVAQLYQDLKKAG
jgi:hypothetical protein